MTDKLEATLVCIPLSDLAEVRTGIAKGKPFDSDCVEVPYLRVANVQDGRLDLREVKSLRVAVAVVDRYRLRSGDVLLTEGGDIDKLGRGCVWHGQVEPCLHQNHVFAVRPKVHLLDATYLAAVAGSDYGRQYFLGCAKRTTNLASINSSQLKAFPVPFRPLPEQQKIAAILTAVDDKLDLIARQISATQTLKQGLMQTLFTRGAGTPDAQGRWHPHTEFQDSPIGQIPRSWEARKLEELATENITYGVVQPGEVCEGGVPLVRGGDIKNGKIAPNLRTVSQEISLQFKRTVLQGGELLVSLVGYPGETAVVPEELAGANIARQAGMIRTRSVAMSKFIHCYLASPAGKTCLLGGMIGSAQQVINLKSLREVYVPMPADAERDQISAICEEVFKKLDVLTTQQTHYQSLKRGLMQKLLTGQWRVRVDAATLAPVNEEAPA